MAAPFGWRCLSTPPCSISCGPSKIPYGGFSPVRLQTTTPPGVCLGQPRLKGTRLSTPTTLSWLRPTGHSTRSRSSSRNSCHDGGYHESSTGAFLASGCSVRRVIGTAPRSARLGATPRFRGSRLYGRPCLSRVLQAGPKSFPALPRYPEYHAVSPTPEGSSGANSHRFPDATRLRPTARDSTPSWFPLVRFDGTSFRRGRVRFRLRPSVLLAPGSDLTFRRPGHDPRSFHQASHLLLVRDWLHGRMGSCHGRTPPTGFLRLQAAPL